MSALYKGDAARNGCGQRIRAELADFAITRAERPLTFDENTTLSWIARRCDACRSCPGMLALLRIMMPPRRTPATSAPNVIPFKRSA
jgi:hypothetical protein